MNEAKPFEISKREVWEAYRKVKGNKGAAGVDEQTIAEFEEALKDNLYKLWNRMSSGSYFPPPVKVVEIPKDTGGKRKLGISTVSDRIAQTVATSRLVELLDPLFHPDSYAYRPGNSALDAVAQARQRCWRYDWVIDLDIKVFFDNIDWELLSRAVTKHVKDEWVILYIERWLKAPEQDEQGHLHERVKGSPRGESFLQCWPICFCIMSSICGSSESIRRSHSTDRNFKCDTKSLVEVVPTVKEGTSRVTG